MGSPAHVVHTWWEEGFLRDLYLVAFGRRFWKLARVCGGDRVCIGAGVPRLCLFVFLFSDGGIGKGFGLLIRAVCRLVLVNPVDAGIGWAPNIQVVAK